MIIVLCGKSACGKDTIRNELVKLGCESVVGVTTRPMRIGEMNGREYEFVTEDEINKMELLEKREYETVCGKWIYGTKKVNVKGKDKVMILDLNGAERVKEIYGEECIVVYVSCRDKVREERARKREGERWDEREWERRKEKDGEDFEVFKRIRICEYVVDGEKESRENGEKDWGVCKAQKRRKY